MTYVEDVLLTNSAPVILDLSKVDFLDSSGLGALVQIAKQFTNFLIVGSAILHFNSLVQLIEGAPRFYDIALLQNLYPPEWSTDQN